MLTFFGRLKNEMFYGHEKEYESFESFAEAIEEYIENLSVCIINLIEIFEPEVIGLGGSFVHFGPKGFQLNEHFQKIAEENCKVSGGSFLVTDEEEAMKHLKARLEKEKVVV